MTTTIIERTIVAHCPRGYTPGPPDRSQGAAAFAARLADVAARRFGLSVAERDAYERAAYDAPCAYYSRDGRRMRPVPVHDIGMTAARGIA